MPRSLRVSDNDIPTGGVALPTTLRRKLPVLASGTTALVRHIQRLKALHPEVHLKFRDVKLAEMDVATLQLLLEDLNEQLGVD